MTLRELVETLRENLVFFFSSPFRLYERLMGPDVKFWDAVLDTQIGELLTAVGAVVVILWIGIHTFSSWVSSVEQESRIKKIKAYMDDQEKNKQDGENRER